MAWTLTAFFVAALLLTAACLDRERRRNAALRAQLGSTENDLQHLQLACSKLASAGVVQRLLDSESAAAMIVPERKVVTVLFADLIGYTAMSEQVEAGALVEMLNGYFERASEAIQANGGHVAKFLGDGILAHFGALQPNPWQCDDAVRAALAIRSTIAEYNERLAEERLPQLGVGIGIHRGPGLVGLVGSRDRMDYDFIGRTVNLAARVESLTRVLDVDILITEAVRSEIGKRFVLESMPPQVVKGIPQAVTTYAVLESRARP